MARPWEQRAIELEPIEGHYADYAAFREWFSQQEDEIDLVHEQMDCVLDAYQMITLYVLFCHAFDEKADTPVVVEAKANDATASINEVILGWRCQKCDEP